RRAGSKKFKVWPMISAANKDTKRGRFGRKNTSQRAAFANDVKTYKSVANSNGRQSACCMIVQICGTETSQNAMGMRIAMTSSDRMSCRHERRWSAALWFMLVEGSARL